MIQLNSCFIFHINEDCVVSKISLPLPTNLNKNLLINQGGFYKLPPLNYSNSIKNDVGYVLFCSCSFEKMKRHVSDRANL